MFENWSNLKKSFDEGNIKNTDFAINDDFYNIVNGKKYKYLASKYKSIYLVDIDGQLCELCEVTYCPKRRRQHFNVVRQRECKIATKEGNKINKIFSGDKVKYIFPNVLSELMIQIILSELVYNLESINFPKIYSAYCDFNNYMTYSLSESCSTIKDIEYIRKQPFHFAEGFNVLFQISYALSVAQKKFSFTHYNLHGSNILFRPLSQDEKYIRYPLYDDNGNMKYIYVSNMGYSPVITNFHFSRLESDGKIVESAVPNLPSKSYGGFDSHIDFLSFLGSLLFDDNPSFQLNQIMRNAGFGKNIISNLLYQIFKTTNSKVIKSYYNNSKSKWEMGDFLFDYGSILNTDEITQLLADKLVKSGLAFYNEDIPPSVSTVELNTIQYKKNFEVMKENFSINDEINFGNGFIYAKYSFKDIVDQFYKNGIPNYIHTPGKNLYKKCYESDQVFHVMFVDRQKAINNGYTIVNDCCKIDPIDYIKFNEGFVINGGFFNFTTTYDPIGPYKNSRTQNYALYNDQNQIPELYKDSYGVIYFNQKFNTINIEPYVNFDQFEDPPDSFFSSGPILINNGEIVFTEKELSKKTPINSKNTYKYQCRVASIDETKNKINPKYFDSSNLVQKNSQCVEETVHIDDAMPNCSKINPGELSHASNPNPRSAFVIRNNIDGKGDYAFIVLEGRRNNGDGLDLHILSEILLLSPINALNAINLDGGVSSNFAWRFGNSVSENFVVTPNRYRPNYYPVGNVFGFVKN